MPYATARRGRPRKNGPRYPSGKLHHANGEPIDALMKWRRQREAVEAEVIDRRGLGFTWPTKPRNASNDVVHETP